MSKLSGAQILINTLAEHGVEYIFGYPGASVLSVYDALPSSPIRHILTAHEQGACFAAEGYARSSGRTGVVLTTSGPGATNLITGIADAYMDSIPLVAITGNVSLEKLGHDSFQEVDVFDMTMPITKYSIIVKSADEIAPSIRKAFAVAERGRKGPVLVDIPSNIFDQKAEYEREIAQKSEPATPDSEQIAAAAELINQSRHPVIYAGGGVKFSGASDALAAFALQTFAPVTVSYMGIGCFNPDDPSYLGVLSNNNQTTTQALKECDLLITLGARFNSRYTAFNTIKKRKIPLLQIDIDRAEIDKNLLTTAYIVGDIRLALEKLTPMVAPRCDDEWAFRDFPQFEEKPNRGIEIIRALSDKLGDSVYVATDVGLHQEWTAHNYKFRTPEKFLTSGGLGSMGFSMGAAIGAHFACGGKCLVITGDGSFNMNFNELATAVKNRVPLIIAVMNNNSLGMIRKLQIERGNRRTPMSSLYLSTDYVALAQAMGARGVRISPDDDISAVLDEALNGALPVVIDCQLSINDGIKE